MCHLRGDSWCLIGWWRSRSALVIGGWERSGVTWFLVAGVQLSSGVQSGRRLQETEVRKRRHILSHTRQLSLKPSRARPARASASETRPHVKPGFSWEQRVFVLSPHHRQVSVLRLGHDELRSRREVDGPFFPLTQCKLDAVEEHQRSQTAAGDVGSRGATRSAPHLPWLMLMLLILSAQMAILVRVSMTWSLCRITSPCEETGRPWSPPDRPDRFIQKEAAALTFCLLSSVGTCRTNRPSLSELTEIPAGRGVSFQEQRIFNTCRNKVSEDLSELRNRCAAWLWRPLRWWRCWRWAAAGGIEPCSPSGRTWWRAQRTGNTNTTGRLETLRHRCSDLTTAARLTFIFSLPRAWITFGLRSSPSGEEGTLKIFWTCRNSRQGTTL